MSKKTYKKRILALEPGQWVDVGFYTSGEVVEVDPEFQNHVTVRFGSEIVSLDQLDTSFKLSEEEPKRSLKNIFNPGQWIKHDTFGIGSILTVSDVFLQIRFGIQIKKIAPGRDDLKVNLLPIPPLNMHTLIEQRRVFFDTKPGKIAGLRSCHCCGYPTINEFFPDPVHDDPDMVTYCVICGWEDDGFSNPTPPEMEKVSEIYGSNLFSDKRYSLAEARKNFESYGTMFNPEDQDKFLIVTEKEMNVCRTDLLSLFDQLFNGNYKDKKMILTNIFFHLSVFNPHKKSHS